MGAENSKQRRHYADVLEHLKTYFPSPVSEAEIQAIAMLSDLIGYDPQRSGGSMKSFIMSPWTNIKAVNLVVEPVIAARAGLP